MRSWNSVQVLSDKPWWLPRDLRLTRRGRTIWEYSIGFLITCGIVGMMWLASLIGYLLTGVPG